MRIIGVPYSGTGGQTGAAEGSETADLALYSPRTFLQFSGPFSLRHPNDLFTFRNRDKKDSGQKLVGTEMTVSSQLAAY